MPSHDLKSNRAYNKFMFKQQRGFATIELIVALIVLAGLLFVGLKLRKTNPKTDNTATQTQSQTMAQNDEPLPLESIGFNLDYYDPTTNHAGDMEFTNVDHTLSGHIHQIWQDFGQQDTRTSDTTKKNPQPTYVLPLHTKVHALVTGVVTDVKQLYSNDYTIWMSGFSGSKYTYETEHVDNPSVKKGEHVAGGQIIAEVSDKDSGITPGFGLLEIGILYTGNSSPQHLCPFQYLDPKIKGDIGKKITALHASWEAYYGQKVYDEPFVTPGCVSLDKVNG